MPKYSLLKFSLIQWDNCTIRFDLDLYLSHGNENFKTLLLLQMVMRKIFKPLVNFLVSCFHKVTIFDFCSFAKIIFYETLKVYHNGLCVYCHVLLLNTNMERQLHH